MNSRQLRTGTLSIKADREPDAVIETFGCNLTSGGTMAKFEKAAQYWQTEVEKIASPAIKSYSARLWTPFRGGTAEPDLQWVGAYPDLKTWAQGSTDYYASSQGPRRTGAVRDATSTCAADVWLGHRIAVPASRAQLRDCAKGRIGA